VTSALYATRGNGSGKPEHQNQTRHPTGWLFYCEADVSSRDEIIAIIRECAQKLGRAPSQAEFRRASKISWHQVYKHFRGMRAAVRAAGLEPGPKGSALDANALMLDWARVVRHLQRLPSRAEYDRLGKHHSVTLHARIGWSQMAHSFVLLAREFHIEQDWADVVSIVMKKFPLLGKAASGAWQLPGSKSGLTAENAENAKGAKDKRPIADSHTRTGARRTNPLHTSGAQPGVPDARWVSRGGVEAPSAACSPAHPDNPGKSTTRQHPIQTRVAPALLPVFCPEREMRMGKIVATALAVQILMAAERSTQQSVISTQQQNAVQSVESNSPESPKPPELGKAESIVFGAPLTIAAMAHAPTNEAGVIFLFGALAADLGFRVERLQAAFPDCEAKREVVPGKWERVRIEFEFESRNFREHRHDPAGCDVIVCWRHNWPDCPKRLEVVELGRAVG
jgi:hypothetical protein